MYNSYSTNQYSSQERSCFELCILIMHLLLNSSIFFILTKIILNIRNTTAKNLLDNLIQILIRISVICNSRVYLYHYYLYCSRFKCNSRKCNHIQVKKTSNFDTISFDLKSKTINIKKISTLSLMLYICILFIPLL